MTETAAVWGSSTTASEIAAWLKPKRSVVVVTHGKPDGDALGSSLGLVRTLNIAAGGSAAGFSGVASRAEAWYAGPMPGWWKAVALDTKCRHFDEHNHPPSAAEPDAVVIVDTGSWSQLHDYRPWIDAQHDRSALIDHHLSGNAEVSPRRLIDTGAAAACEIVAGLCVTLLGLDSPADLPREIAEPLYLGLATDTGWFRHSNVTPAVMRLGADLLEAGVDHERLIEVVEFRDRPGRLRLLSRALGSLELLDDDRIAVLSLREKDFEKANAHPGDSGGFLDIVKSVETVRVGVLLTELKTPDGPVTKVSMRSKGGASFVDVNVVAKGLGGGGHAQAAGARLPGVPLADAKAKIVGALQAALDGAGS
jgi:phosphoesterase RecJ-like protein